MPTTRRRFVEAALASALAPAFAGCDVREFARHHPALVVGGGFAIGLLAARFLKSSGGADRAPDAFRYDYTSEGSLT